MTRHKYPHVTSVYGMGKNLRQEKPYQVNLDGEKEDVSLFSKAVLWILTGLAAWLVFYGAYWLVQTVVDAVRGTPVLERSHPQLPGTERTEWYTPDDLFQEISAKYGPFTLDVAASPDNAKCVEYFTVEQNGLLQKWFGRAWCNPPYRDLIKWVRKAFEETQAGRCEIAVLLLPAHTSTAWFHDYALPYAELYWVRGKRKFGGCADRALMPSVAVVFRKVAP